MIHIFAYITLFAVGALHIAIGGAGAGEKENRRGGLALTFLVFGAWCIGIGAALAVAYHKGLST